MSKSKSVSAAVAASVNAAVAVSLTDAAYRFGKVAHETDNRVADAQAVIRAILGEATFNKGWDGIGEDSQAQIKAGVLQSLIESTPDLYFKREEDRTLTPTYFAEDADVVVSAAFAMSEEADARKLKETDFNLYLIASCPTSKRPAEVTYTSVRAKVGNLLTKRIARIFKITDVDAVEAIKKGRGTAHADEITQLVNWCEARLEIMAKQAKKITPDKAAKFARCRDAVKALLDTAK
jgi:hypothetical protein